MAFTSQCNQCFHKYTFVPICIVLCLMCPWWGLHVTVSLHCCLLPLGTWELSGVSTSVPAPRFLMNPTCDTFAHSFLSKERDPVAKAKLMPSERLWLSGIANLNSVPKVAADQLHQPIQNPTSTSESICVCICAISYAYTSKFHSAPGLEGVHLECQGALPRSRNPLARERDFTNMSSSND